MQNSYHNQNKTVLQLDEPSKMCEQFKHKYYHSSEKIHAIVDWPFFATLDFSDAIDNVCTDKTMYMTL